MTNNYKTNQLQKMIANIEDYKAAIMALASASVGTMYNFYPDYLLNFSLAQANTAFQHLAWTVAILAGIVSIINGVRQWKFKKHKVYQKLSSWKKKQK